MVGHAEAQWMVSFASVHETTRDNTVMSNVLQVTEA